MITEHPSKIKFLKRSFFQRILGKCVTSLPADPGCWTYSEGVVTLDLQRAPELSKPGAALRIEGEGLPKRVLLVHGDDGQYHAFCNQCSHGGRRLDPVAETGTVQCCSVGKSTFTYEGRLVFGSAKKDIAAFPLREEDRKLLIDLPNPIAQ